MTERIDDTAKKGDVEAMRSAEDVLETKSISLAELELAVSKFLIVEDPYVIKIICAAILANNLNSDVVWLILNAPPSGGKSEFIQALYDLPCVYPISSLTTKTFVSGINMGDGKEASLLDDLHNKTMLFKDFTTIVEMSNDNRREILSQMREVFDGDFRKDFGTGKKYRWKGRVGAIAAITPGGAKVLQDSAQMGERFIQYKIAQPDRMKVLAKGHENRSKDINQLREDLREAFNDFLEQKIEAIDNFEVQYDLPNEVREELSRIADFATRARSHVEVNWKSGEVEYVPPKEMPTRFLGQLISLAMGIFVINEKNELNQDDFLALSKVGLDSIPDNRVMVLEKLTQYKSVATGSVAAELHYPTITVRRWLDELAGLGIIKRYKHSRNMDVWAMNDEDRITMSNMTGIKATTEELIIDDVEEELPEVTPEMSKLYAEVDSIVAADTQGKLDADFKDF